MKRILSAAIAAVLTITVITGCRQNSPDGSASGDSDTDKISIVCTVFPQYDWVRQILGDRADAFELTLLLSSRVDLHNYQPSVDDIVTITTCDLFIYVGGESDEWVEDVLAQSMNPDMITVSLMDILGDEAKIEEIIEGMQEEEEEEGEEEEYDEHVWLSLRNAQMFCIALGEALEEIDPGNADVYGSNLSTYLRELSALDLKYKEAAGAAAVNTLLFADRFPFRYLLDDYGIEYYAAFPGCSAETEASFETVVFLTEKADELNLKCIMVTESSDKSIANTIISNTAGKDQNVYVLDAMQSISSADIQSGASYLSVMESNLNVLIQAMA